MKKQLLTAILSLCSIIAFSKTIYGHYTICSAIHRSYSIVSTGANSFTWSVPSVKTIAAGEGSILINFGDLQLLHQLI